MSKQQMGLSGSEKARTWVDELKAERFIKGQLELVEALNLQPDSADSLRRHAVALYSAGKLEACIDVVLGLAALGNVHPADPLLLSRCYAALGDAQNAAVCAEHHARMMKELGR